MLPDLSSCETKCYDVIEGETIDGDLITCHNGDTWVYSGIVGGGVGYFADLLVYAEAKRWLGTLRYLVGCKSLFLALRFFPFGASRHASPGGTHSSRK